MLLGHSDGICALEAREGVRRVFSLLAELRLCAAGGVSAASGLGIVRQDDACLESPHQDMRTRALTRRLTQPFLGYERSNVQVLTSEHGHSSWISTIRAVPPLRQFIVTIGCVCLRVGFVDNIGATHVGVLWGVCVQLCRKLCVHVGSCAWPMCARVRGVTLRFAPSRQGLQPVAEA